MADAKEYLDVLGTHVRSDTQEYFSNRVKRESKDAIAVLYDHADELIDLGIAPRSAAMFIADSISDLEIWEEYLPNDIIPAAINAFVWMTVPSILSREYLSDYEGIEYEDINWNEVDQEIKNAVSRAMEKRWFAQETVNTLLDSVFPLGEDA